MRKEEYVQAFSQVHAPKALTEKLLQPKLRPNYTRKFAVLAACAVIASILGAFLMGSTDETDPKKTFVSVDWNMYAQLIRVEDEKIEVLDRFNIKIESSFTESDPDWDRYDINLRITPPDDFPLLFTPPGNHGEYWNLQSYNLYTQVHSEVGTTLKKLSVPYHYTGFHTLQPIHDEMPLMVYTSFAFCPYEKYAIMCWDDGEPVYLVASLDPDADPATIMEYFRYMLENVADRGTDNADYFQTEFQRIKEMFKVQYENLEASFNNGEVSKENYTSLQLHLQAEERKLVNQYEQLICDGIWGQYKTE